jgi:hypothetical protein
MAEKMRRDWYHRVLADAIEALSKRPASRRGPFLITDEQLRNARRALDEATHDG